jgi:hypothetical protein
MTDAMIFMVKKIMHILPFGDVCSIIYSITKQMELIFVTLELKIPLNLRTTICLS